MQSAVPLPSSERRTGILEDEIDAQQGPKGRAVRSCFDANHRQVRILLLGYRYTLFFPQSQVQDLLKERTVSLSVGVEPSALVE